MTATFKCFGWWQKERPQSQLTIIFLICSVIATILLSSWGSAIAAGIGGFVSGVFFGFGWRKLRISGLCANVITVSIITWLRSDWTPLAWFTGFFFICLLFMHACQEK
jgi:hypothetical protein